MQVKLSTATERRLKRIMKEEQLSGSHIVSRLIERECAPPESYYGVPVREPRKRK